MKRMGHGLQGQINYTWSHCLDTVSNGGFLQFSAGGILSPLPGELARDYGSCDYDIRSTSRRLKEQPARIPGSAVRELVDPIVFPHISTRFADQGLDLALERMSTNQIEILPVVSRTNVHQLVGMVTLREVLHSYGVSPPNRA